MPPESARVTVYRNLPIDVQQRQIYVTLDGQPWATLLFGQSATREIPPGEHRLKANNTLVWKTIVVDAKPGEQIYDVIRDLGSRGKIFSVHFRNIAGGFLNFRETHIDNGDVDMLKAMRVYKEIGFDGMMMPDHVPQIEGDPGGMQGFAFAIGYIKALIAAVSAEA